MTETVNKHRAAIDPDLLSGEEIMEDVIASSVLLQAYGRDVRTAPWFMQDMQYRADIIHGRDAELAELFVDNDVEGMHGSRSGSLLMIAQHGLLPVSQQKNLPSPVITGEHWTQPKLREGSHVVHWVFSDSTRQYAEEAERSGNGMSIRNYQDALNVQDEYIQAIHPTLAIRTYLEVRKRKASEFDGWLQSGKASPLEIMLHERDFPVVLGVGLEGIDAEDIAGVNSSVSGDCIITAAIPPKNIKILFVPESQIEFTQENVTLTQDTQILPLERLRATTGGI